jgi:hypothetical protein
MLFIGLYYPVDHLFVYYCVAVIHIPEMDTNFGIFLFEKTSFVVLTEDIYISKRHDFSLFLIFELEVFVR